MYSTELMKDRRNELRKRHFVTDDDDDDLVCSEKKQRNKYNACVLVI